MFSFVAFTSIFILVLVMLVLAWVIPEHFSD